jgi:hypothetical protein
MVAVITGIVISLSVSGQTNGVLRNCDNKVHKSHFLLEKPAQPSFNKIDEAWQPVYKSTQGSFPQEIQHFYWDITTIWMADFNRVVSYDNYGKILTEISMNANTGDTTDRTVYTYDSQGRETQILNQIWITGSWENVLRQVYTYDLNNNREVYLEQSWQAGSWVTVGGSKYVYTYDGNNHITEEIIQYWDTNINNWHNWDRHFYTYNVNGYLIENIVQWWDDINNVWNSIGKNIFTLSGSGVIIEILNQSWDNPNSVWVNQQKYVDIVWHEWNGYFNDPEVESYTELNWNNGIWENYSRVSTTYDAYGSSVRITQYYSNSNWVNSSRESSIYDAHGNFIEFTYEFWMNNTWVIDIGTKFLLTYNGNDVIQRIFQNYDHAMMVWVNVWKEVYSNFIYTQGISSGSLLKAGISLFPNPASGILNIRADDSGMKIKSIEIVSMSGQVVYEMQVSSTGQNEFQIDVSDFKEAVYFVKLQDATGIKIGKVIVQ